MKFYQRRISSFTFVYIFFESFSHDFLRCKTRETPTKFSLLIKKGGEDESNLQQKKKSWDVKLFRNLLGIPFSLRFFFPSRLVVNGEEKRHHHDQGSLDIPEENVISNKHENWIKNRNTNEITCALLKTTMPCHSLHVFALKLLG